MMPAHCCVPKCNGKGGHKFPTNPSERKLWIQAVKRGETNWLPSKFSVVCRAHFDESDYLTETKEKDKIVNKVLKAGSTTHIFIWKRPNQSQNSRRQRAYKRQTLEEMDRNSMSSVGLCENVGNEVEISCTPTQQDCSSTEAPVPVTRSTCTQTTVPVGFSAQKYMLDPKRFHFYTGLETHEAFKFVFYTLGETANELNYYYGTMPCMSTEDQFFLTMVKLRLARSNFELADMFQISEKEVVNIFVTSINFLYFQFKDIDWWPSRDLVKFYSPADFKSKFSSTRVIIDGIPIKRPKQPVIQQGTYSTYKNRNTVKVLVGLTPGGMVSYVSEAYGGAASDRQICERRKLMTMCDPGDSVMADKGLNVQDFFIPSNVIVNIPEFFKKRNRMSATSVVSNRKIASKRVHVERIIGLAKTFKILTQPLNNTECTLADAIISVCFYLCNFRTNIVS